MTARMPSPLPVDQWPAVDRAAWERALQADPLAPGGGGSAGLWRPSTRRFVLTHYGRWLSWMEAAGTLDPNSGIEERATKERVRAYLDEMRRVGFADYTRAGALQGLADAIRVMSPGADVRFVGRAAGRISSGAQRARDLASRFRPPVEVLDFARSLMEGPEAQALPPLRRSIAFRDGLLMALWTYRPLRVSNLAHIAIGESLRRSPQGHRLVFSPREMKARRPWECSWPKALEAGLEVYLTKHRPMLLLQGEGDAASLWLSQFGRGMPASSVAQIIKLRTRARFGQHLNSHLMRYMAATGIAEAFPKNRTDVAAILGHASMETSDKHYILAGGSTAAKMYQDVVFRRRDPKGRTQARRPSSIG